MLLFLSQQTDVYLFYKCYPMAWMKNVFGALPPLFLFLFSPQNEAKQNNEEINFRMCVPMHLFMSDNGYVH